MLVEVPVAAAFDLGMHRGPLLAYLLADPEACRVLAGPAGPGWTATHVVPSPCSARSPACLARRWRRFSPQTRLYQERRKSYASHTTPPPPSAIFGRLSLLDRFLPLWIFLAMAAGVILGAIFPGIQDTFDSLRIDTVSFPIAIGLLWMMYPVLAKVKYEEMGRLHQQGRLFGVSILQNWIIGPALMTALAWLFLSDYPEYRTGLIIVGLARCIAMVLIWNMLAGGDSEDCAALVALNSVFQIVMYSPLAYFYLTVVPKWFGASTAEVGVTMGDIAKSVLIFLGIPLAAGIITRFTLIASAGAWYDGEFRSAPGGCQ